MTALVEARDLSYSFPGAARPAFQGIDLSLGAGQCLCLTGPSGCGKTTLLKGVMGLLPAEGLSGELRRPAGARAGMVLQNLDAQLLCTTVGDEAAFAPQNLGLGPEAVAARVRAGLEAVGLCGLEGRNVEELSAGQKARLCLASVLTMEPGLIILDEPCGQIDRHGREAMVRVLTGLKARGHALLIAEHNLPALAGLPDEYLLLDGEGRPLRRGAEPPLPSEPPAEAWPGAPPGRPVLEARGLCLDGPAGPVLDGLELVLGAGQCLHLTGPNATGKSTLLRCLAGVLRPQRGGVLLDGKPLPRPGAGLGRLGLLFQNPARQLFEDSVAAEVGFGLRRMGLDRGQVRRRTEEALAMCEAGHLARRPPLTLSYGEQHRVALAAALALRPRVLLCDEPLAGLDLAQRRRVLSALARFGARDGSTLLIASHDPLPQPGWAGDARRLVEGRLARA